MKNKSEIFKDFTELAAEILGQCINEAVENNINTVIKDAYDNVLKPYDVYGNENVLYDHGMKEAIALDALELALQNHKEKMYNRAHSK